MLNSQNKKVGDGDRNVSRLKVHANVQQQIFEEVSITKCFWRLSSQEKQQHHSFEQVPRNDMCIRSTVKPSSCDVVVDDGSTEHDCCLFQSAVNIDFF